MMAGIKKTILAALMMGSMAAEAKVDSLNFLINQAEVEQYSSAFDIQIMLDIDPQFMNLNYPEIADIVALEQEVSIVIKKLEKSSALHKTAEKKTRNQKKSRSIASVADAT